MICDDGRAHGGLLCCAVLCCTVQTLLRFQLGVGVSLSTSTISLALVDTVDQAAAAAGVDANTYSVSPEVARQSSACVRCRCDVLLLLL